MGIDVSTLEPAERDPAKLRKTAFILLAMMVIGGVMIMWAYQLKTNNESDRPAIVKRLESNFAAINQEGETVDLGQLEGEIWLATTIALSQKEVSAEALAVMRELEAAYSPDEVAKFVCLTIDPNNDTPIKLLEFAQELGVSSDRWWFLAAGEKPIRGYVKDKMLLGSVSEVGEGEERRLVFPSLIGVFDQYRHLRGPRYDFKQAREVSESAQKLLREEPERAEEFYRDFGSRPEDYLEEPQRLREQLKKTIDLLLTEDLKENQ